MATQTQTAPAQPAAPGPFFEPNVKPDGIEVAGDRKWRDWRLRKRRPDLRQRFTDTFPDINPLLERRAQDLIDAQAVAGRGTKFQHRTILDLPGNGYIVEQLQFRPLQATQDRVDSIWTATRPRKPLQQDEIDRLPTFFFEEITTSLFARVWDFAGETFGQQIGNGPRVDRLVRSKDWTGELLQKLPDDFIRCVSETARADRNMSSPSDPTGYERLFLSRESRISLCTAVIARLLQENCFDSLLFGARRIEREALRKIDESQEDTADGFARKMSRTASVPKYLTHELFTENFWPEVDRITLGILKLLIPMINFAGELQPNASWPPLTEVHQNLHNIVAEAGWLANGLALTRSCFWIDFPQPGQLWDLRQEHVSDIIWARSKGRADQKDGNTLNTQTQQWLVDRDAAYNAVAPPKPAREGWEIQYEGIHPRPRQAIRRTAKVQISLWPFFERSYPYRQDLVSGDINSGESTTVLQKAQVVYYAGDDSDAADQIEDYTLRQHIDDYIEANSYFQGPRAWFTWPLLVLLLSAALYAARPTLQEKFDGVSNRNWPLANPLPGWNWPTSHWPEWQRHEDLPPPGPPGPPSGGPGGLAGVVRPHPAGVVSPPGSSGDDAPSPTTSPNRWWRPWASDAASPGTTGPSNPPVSQPPSVPGGSLSTSLHVTRVGSVPSSPAPANGPAAEPANGPAAKPANGPAAEPTNGPAAKPADEGPMTSSEGFWSSMFNSRGKLADQRSADMARDAQRRKEEYEQRVKYDKTAEDREREEATQRQKYEEAIKREKDEALKHEKEEALKREKDEALKREKDEALKRRKEEAAQAETDQKLVKNPVPAQVRKDQEIQRIDRSEKLVDKINLMRGSIADRIKHLEKGGGDKHKAALTELQRLRKILRDMEATLDAYEAADGDAPASDDNIKKIEAIADFWATKEAEGKLSGVGEIFKAVEAIAYIWGAPVEDRPTQASKGFLGKLFGGFEPAKDTRVEDMFGNGEEGVMVRDGPGIAWIPKDVYLTNKASKYQVIVGEELVALLSKLKAAAKASGKTPWYKTRPADEVQGPSLTVEIEADTVFTDPADPGVTLDMAKGFWLQDTLLGHEYGCWIKTKVGLCVTIETVVVPATAAPTVTESPWKQTA